jgi:hypothetical protein
VATIEGSSSSGTSARDRRAPVARRGEDDGAGSEGGDGGDDLASHHLERRDLIDAHDPAEDRLDAQARQPAELAQQLADLRPVRTDVEAEGGRPLDRVVVEAMCNPSFTVFLSRSVWVQLDKGRRVASAGARAATTRPQTSATTMARW